MSVISALAVYRELLKIDPILLKRNCDSETINEQLRTTLKKLVHFILIS